jgi:hypothetical protein
LLGQTTHDANEAERQNERISDNQETKEKEKKSKKKENVQRVDQNTVVHLRVINLSLPDSAFKKQQNFFF